MRIDRVEIDDNNVNHVTSHGVTIAEIEAVFNSQPTIRRNKGGGPLTTTPSPTASV